MHALGMIETMGLIPSIEALDAMLKAANVETLEKTNVRGGIVTVLVVGDVSAVKAAVDAGAAAAQCVSQGALLSQHVIPRPDSQINSLFKSTKEMHSDIETIDEREKPEDVEDEPLAEDAVESEDVLSLSTRAEVEAYLQEQGVEKLMQAISNMKASEIKQLAKEYEDGELLENKNARTTKAELINQFYDFYTMNNEEKNT